ncbi:Pyridoxal-dependent decarboxylase (fragment) [Bradyrhizobium sp. STM 3843]
MSSDQSFQRALQRAFTHALAHLSSAETAPVNATTGLTELRARFGKPLPESGTDAAEVIDDLVRDAEGSLLGCNGGRFFGWVIGGTLPAALAADWLVSTWDQNAAIHACGPAEAVIEEIAGAWLKDLFGLPQTASFAFVTGTQMAHVTCLAAARHRLLARAGWDVEEHGLTGAPPIRVLTSSERHGSVERAVRMLGLGKRAITALPCNSSGRLEPDVLARALDAAPSQPTIVVLHAGDLNIGAFDPSPS